MEQLQGKPIMTYQDETDGELVELARDGERRAFEELVKRHTANTYRQCYKILNCHEDAEDLTQEVFLKAYQALPTFRRESRFSTWLYTITRNACLMRLRKRKLDTVSLDRPLECDDGDVERQVVDTSADPSRAVLLRELSDVLYRQVDDLGPTNRVIFELRLLGGLSTDETACILGLTSSSVRSRLHRVRRSLREGLRSYLEEGRLSAHERLMA
jgi:RNA polymerase sigma-70 factor, ECF subfamily